MKFEKATKYNSFLKMAIAGPEGSGKSYSALAIAMHLSEKRVAVIDAELGAASKYADKFDFDVLELMLDEEGADLEKPFTPERYIEAMKAASTSGLYDVLVIDGISQEWDDAGGILQLVDWLQSPERGSKKVNTRDAWGVATPRHKKFVNYILRTRMHVICTMRAKKESVTEKDDNGRVTAKKVTMEPIQREDVPYQFDIVGKMERKVMAIDKTRCSLLDDRTFVMPGKEVADIVREWLKGDPMPERPEYDPDVTSPQQQTPQEALKARQIAVYDRLLILGEIDKTVSKEEKLAKFFEIVSEVVGAKVSSLGHITASRLDAVEAYLNGKAA